MTTEPDVTGWPFWAPSDPDSVDQALTLAQLVPGELLVDLGCGDGQVLVAAAERGAQVLGVESDPELAELARAALAERGLDGEVLEGDLFDLDLAADVVFTYLAPATLQRLRPMLAIRHGLRLVTIDFDMPGLDPDETSGAARLYRMPGRPGSGSSDVGWPCDAVIVVAPPGHQSLTALDLAHPGDEVRADLVGAVADLGTLLTGADHVEPREHLAIDIRWEDHEHGTFARGGIQVSGLAELPVFLVFDGDSEEGCWELSLDGLRGVERHLSQDAAPIDGASLVAAAAQPIRN